MFPFRQFRFGKRGFLRPWVLSVINKSPKNGAEIIDDVEKMSFGGWRPSPGSVYPLLDEMTKEGLVQKRTDGRYELTEKGKEEVEWPFGAPMQRGQNSVEGILAEMRDDASYLEDLAKSNPQKIQAVKDRVREIGDRLSQVANS
jgi:DNA-binding PadR family transcriptional regulator